VALELPALVEQHFAASPWRSIFGHSMGGHGALVTALRHPGRYQSVSAFSPIVAPSQVPWGQKAMEAYLGSNRETWKAWDAVELVQVAGQEKLPLLVDQGDADEFLASHLRPELLQAGCKAAGHPLTLRMQPGYDHSHYFIATFLADHFAHHCAALAAATN
jgi:S-formylglutathione hydrolase